MDEDIDFLEFVDFPSAPQIPSESGAPKVEAPMQGTGISEPVASPTATHASTEASPKSHFPVGFQPSLPPFPALPNYARPSRAMPRRAIGDADTANDGHTLGLALLLTGIGAAIGTSHFGLYGGAGGGLAGGSVANMIRAYKYSRLGTDEGSKEAGISLTYSVIGLAVAGYLFYQGHQKKSASAGAKYE